MTIKPSDTSKALFHDDIALDETSFLKTMATCETCGLLDEQQRLIALLHEAIALIECAAFGHLPVEGSESADAAMEAWDTQRETFLDAAMRQVAVTMLRRAGHG